MQTIQIGPVTLAHRAVFGPMAGFTDAPCRRLMAQHGAGFTVSEMVSSRALTYHDYKTLSLVKAEPNGAPYGVQIFGEVPSIMGEAAAALEEYDFDFLDINMGCPAPKIVSGGAGSKLMLHPELCGEIVAQVKAHTSRPVTVKMRKGWDADHVTAVECAKACEEAGAVLIAVHARTRMNALRRQVEEMVELKGERTAMPQARAQAIHYMKGLKGAAALRRACCQLTYLSDLDELIETVFDEQRRAARAGE